MNKKKKTRTILVVLTNRFNRNEKPRFWELSCKADGTILKERVLKRKPVRAVYDEVWSNDQGKESLHTCTRMTRLYRHPLQRVEN
jgi:hypothetical protein